VCSKRFRPASSHCRQPSSHTLIIGRPNYRRGWAAGPPGPADHQSSRQLVRLTGGNSCNTGAWYWPSVLRLLLLTWRAAKQLMPLFTRRPHQKVPRRRHSRCLEHTPSSPRDLHARKFDDRTDPEQFMRFHSFIDKTNKFSANKLSSRYVQFRKRRKRRKKRKKRLSTHCKRLSARWYW